MTAESGLARVRENKSMTTLHRALVHTLVAVLMAEDSDPSYSRLGGDFEVRSAQELRLSRGQRDQVRILSGLVCPDVVDVSSGHWQTWTSGRSRSYAGIH